VLAVAQRIRQLSHPDKCGGLSDDEIPAAASACGHQHQHESIKEAAIVRTKRDAQACKMSM
jgi:hypothetical protein